LLIGTHYKQAAVIVFVQGNGLFMKIYHTNVIISWYIRTFEENNSNENTGKEKLY